MSAPSRASSSPTSASAPTREDGAARQRVVGERLHAARSAASAAELVRRRWIGDLELVGEPERPAGGGDRLLGCHAGMERGLHELAGLGIGPEDAEVGDDDLRAPAAQAEALAVALAVAEADRRAEVAALDERARPSAAR